MLKTLRVISLSIMLLNVYTEEKGNEEKMRIMKIMMEMNINGRQMKTIKKHIVKMMKKKMNLNENISVTFFY